MEQERKELPFRNILLEMWEGRCISFQKVKYKIWSRDLRNLIVDDKTYMYMDYTLFFTLN